MDPLHEICLPYSRKDIVVNLVVWEGHSTRIVHMEQADMPDLHDLKAINFQWKPIQLS